MSHIQESVYLDVNVVYLQSVLLQLLFAGKLEVAPVEITTPIVIFHNVSENIQYYFNLFGIIWYTKTMTTDKAILIWYL